jgi:hypothetical protein
MHVVEGRGAPRPCVLYCFRTPPGVKIGRVPFDDEARRALETRYPELAFDWKRISEAQPPVVNEEPWRERRRVERAMKQARAGDRRQPGGDGAAGPAELPEDSASAEGAPGQSETGGTPGAAGQAGSRRKRRRRRGRAQGGADAPRPPAAALPDSAVPDPAPIQPPVIETESPAETS